MGLTKPNPNPIPERINHVYPNPARTLTNCKFNGTIPESHNQNSKETELKPSPKRQKETKTMTKLITREEYMNDSSNLFHSYYMQFVTPETERFILREIGMKKLLSSKCERLNDLYKHSNGGRGGWIWDNSPANLQLMREAKECSPSGYGSQCARTCIGKACARDLIEKSKKGVLA